MLYCIIPNLKLKNLLLVAAGLVFYAWGEPYAVILMVVSILINHFAAIAISKSKFAKCILTLDIVYNVAVIAVFKYLAPSVNAIAQSTVLNISLPIGISFFTFQMMSYVIDVYRDKSTVSKNFVNTMLYISFFPQLIAGPIVKYHDIAAQLEHRRHDAGQIYSGIKRFVFGLFKKVVIADAVAVIADITFESDSISSLSAFTVFASVISYTLQIYFDFSGYSDMAIGMGRMFGFEFPENFNMPYTSGSMREFWRRWHISLSTWFKEYVYIPLGGNRKGKVRTVFNKIIVFALTGIWHGANLTFLLWGLIHGFFMLLEETGFSRFLKKHRIAAHIYVLAVVTLSFALFRADNVTSAALIFKQLFTGFGSAWAESTAVTLSLFSPYNITVIIAGVLMSLSVIKKAAAAFKARAPKIYAVAEAGVCLVAFIYTLSAVVSSDYSPFIYFQF
ncbi:MAG: MBOAT family protein [Clostridiales bacterium]|nr:MBOAT family protein [Clostridiales bacterium]